MNLYYREIGSGEPLVFLHGVLGSGDNWLGIAKGLAERFRCLLPDLRDHGESPRTGVLTYEEMARDVVDFAGGLGLSAFHLLGHSMGGKTAMRCALAYPERIKTLVVADIAPRPYADVISPIVRAMKAVDLAAVTTRKDADAALSAEIPEPWVRSFLLKNLALDGGTASWKCSLDAVLSSIGDLASWRDLPSARFSGNALFLRGERSNFILEEDASLIRGAFPGARLETVPAAGHWINADNPAFVLHILKEFFS